MQRLQQQLEKERKALERMLKKLMKEMNKNLDLGLKNKEMKQDAAAFVDNLSDEILHKKLVNGELKLVVSFSDGNFVLSTVAVDSGGGDCDDLLDYTNYLILLC